MGGSRAGGGWGGRTGVGTNEHLHGAVGDYPILEGVGSRLVDHGGEVYGE